MKSHFFGNEWAVKASIMILNHVLESLSVTGRCSFMLTGGSTAEFLYRVMNRHPQFKFLRNVDFYFSDERCVSPDHVHSNFGMAGRTLFSGGVPADCRVHRIEADNPDLDAAANQYSKLLPERIDCLLLSMGEDGHIASLFQSDSALHERSKLALTVNNKNVQHKRITISPVVIEKARRIFVFCVGERKVALYNQKMKTVQKFDDLPSRLVCDHDWIISKSLV